MKSPVGVADAVAGKGLALPLRRLPPPEPMNAVPEGSVIRIKCPNLACGRILAVPVRARGKLVRCRGCSTTISVPQKRETAREATPTDATDPGD